MYEIFTQNLLNENYKNCYKFIKGIYFKERISNKIRDLDLYHFKLYALKNSLMKPKKFLFYKFTVL